jgi:hypothetical protein
MIDKNKIFTVYDLIIFLKGRIAIIIFSTFLIASISIYAQTGQHYKNHWEVKISRTVDNFALMTALKNIKDQISINSLKFKQPQIKVSAVSLMKNINDLMDIILINNLSNEDILIEGLGEAINMNLMVKQNYYLIIPNKNYDNLDILKENLDKFFLDTNMLTSDLLKETYQLDRTFNLQIYNFSIVDTKKVTGYDYPLFLKVLLISFLVSATIIFIFHIRKFINLF